MFYRWFVSRCAGTVINATGSCGLLPAERRMMGERWSQLSLGGHKSKDINSLALSPLRIASWQPPGLRRCTKPFLPRRRQARGEGGTALEPLPHKRTSRSMRRASPCSIDRREPLMPSNALLGLVKADTPAGETQKKPAAILFDFI